jgi:hypothetical protein
MKNLTAASAACRDAVPPFWVGQAKNPATGGPVVSDNKAIDVYLNDHLAGAMLGADLAERICDQSKGTPLGDLMTSIAPEIEEDRQTLIDLMERMGTSKNPVKQATTWLAEKASRAKFSGATSGESELGAFMALESLTLGVQGKLALWKVLKEVQDQYEPLASTNLDELIARASTQHDALERQRMSAGRLALAKEAADRKTPA